MIIILVSNMNEKYILCVRFDHRIQFKFHISYCIVLFRSWLVHVVLKVRVLKVSGKRQKISVLRSEITHSLEKFICFNKFNFFPRSCFRLQIPTHHSANGKCSEDHIVKIKMTFLSKIIIFRWRLGRFIRSRTWFETSGL